MSKLRGASMTAWAIGVPLLLAQSSCGYMYPEPTPKPEPTPCPAGMEKVPKADPNDYLSLPWEYRRDALGDHCVSAEDAARWWLIVNSENDYPPPEER